MIANLFANLTQNPDSESIDVLLARPGLRLERIVSHGQTSPAGFWYDQEWDEWVVVLQGTAHLRFEGNDSPLVMKSGDHVLIPAHQKHRVEFSDPDGPTLWLALHFED